MSEQLTHKQAAATDNHCPNCGIISQDKEPAVYTCPRCYTEGYECCFPAGSGTICVACENGGDDE